METKENFSEVIQDLYRLHYVTKKFEHFVQYERGSWKLFEPSKFIYAYFSFNSFYNFNWEVTIEKEVLTLFDNETEQSKFSEIKKCRSYIDFICKNLKENDHEKFIQNVLDENSIEEIIAAINGITPDLKIKDSEREDFKREFIELLNSRKIKAGKLKKEILWFIYLVRNNIFHGTKDTIEMSETFQRKRLEIYSNLLIAINDMLFTILEREKCFKPYNRYNLKNF